MACFAAQAAAPAQSSAKEPLTADTPKTTVLGNTFIAPAGWTVSVRGPATILEAPEGGSRIVLVDVRAKDADAAVAAAWAAYQPPKWPLKLATDVPDKDGWSKLRQYSYQTSPNVPANAQDVTKLGTQYKNAALGDIAVERSGAKTVFDFGEWQSEVASRRNPDGTTSFITISPGVSGFEFVVGGDTKKTLTLRDAQHEYLFQSL